MKFALIFSLISFCAIASTQLISENSVVFPKHFPKPFYDFKKNPLSKEIVCNASKADIQSKVVVIVDDVLNSGKTLIYAVKHILDSGPKGVYTTVLVDRIHRSFPVRADYCGLSLSTHLNEHISVKLSKVKSTSDAVFLEL